MSSASAGSFSDNTGEKNFAQVPMVGHTAPQGPPSSTSTVAAEAQQGAGPAASGASASAVGESVARTSAVSVSVGGSYAAAACEFGVVAVGPHSAAAASQVGVAVVAPHGASATSNAANSSQVAVADSPKEQ